MRWAALLALPLLALLTAPARAADGVAPSNDPCKARDGKKWSELAVTPADNIAAALACAAPGAIKITAGPGHYNQVFNVDETGGVTSVELAGAGAGQTVFDGRGGCTVAANNQGSRGPCRTRLAWGNGVIRVAVPAYIHDLEVTGGGTNANDGHDLQAGIYVATPKGEVTLRRIMFRRNQNGLACNADFVAATDVLVDQSDFTLNSVDGGSHDAYCAGRGSFTVVNSNAYGALFGNVYKTRMPSVVIKGGYIRSSDPSSPNTGGRFVDAADGAVLTIDGTTLVGNTCCAAHLGNGEESTKSAAPRTSITGGTLYLATPADFQSPGPITLSGVKQLWGTSARGRGRIGNSFGGKVTGGASSGTSTDEPPPAPPFASGAK
jgi:hypothetical protein